jgi:hypothetical protein
MNIGRLQNATLVALALLLKKKKKKQSSDIRARKDLCNSSSHEDEDIGCSADG